MVPEMSEIDAIQLRFISRKQVFEPRLSVVSSAENAICPVLKPESVNRDGLRQV